MARNFSQSLRPDQKAQEEDAAGRSCIAASVGLPRDRLRQNIMLEPPVNVSVYPFAGRCCFGETDSALLRSIR